MTSDALFDPTSLTADTRTCNQCGTERPIGMFYVAAEARQSITKGTRVRIPCRMCIRDKNRDRLAERYAITDRIKIESGCVDCGIKNPEHPEIFDFDHIDPDNKITTVSVLLTKGTVEELEAEIAKCEVVCANCHRIRTRHLREARSFGRDTGPRRTKTGDAE